MNTSHKKFLLRGVNNNTYTDLLAFGEEKLIREALDLHKKYTFFLLSYRGKLLYEGALYRAQVLELIRRENSHP